MAATASPPPIKTKSGDIQTSRTGSVFQKYIIAMLHIMEIAIPSTERMKTGLLPILLYLVSGLDVSGEM